MVYLPPCSPALNPDEQEWNHAKREIVKLTILNKTMVEKVVLDVVRSLQKKKDLVRSFFQLPGTRYVLETMNQHAGTLRGLIVPRSAYMRQLRSSQKLEPR